MGQIKEIKVKQDDGSYSNATIGANAYRLRDGEGKYSITQGYSTNCEGDYSHAEGYGSNAVAPYSHAEGGDCISEGQLSHAEGQGTHAKKLASHTEGSNTTTESEYAHAEGQDTITHGTGAHAEGHETDAVWAYSHAEGYLTQSNGDSSHAEGAGTVTKGAYSHAEGYGLDSITITDPEGVGGNIKLSKIIANGVGAHAEGGYTRTIGNYSHAEGYGTKAKGDSSHAEGVGTIAKAEYSHVGGYFNISHENAMGTTVFGYFNSPVSNSIFEIGCGTDVEDRKNAITVLDDGSVNIPSLNLVSENLVVLEGALKYNLTFSTWISGVLPYPDGFTKDNVIVLNTLIKGFEGEGYVSGTAGLRTINDGLNGLAISTTTHTGGFSIMVCDPIDREGGLPEVWADGKTTTEYKIILMKYA